MKTKIMIFGFCLLVVATLFGCGTRSESYTENTAQSITSAGESGDFVTDSDLNVSSAKDNETYEADFTDAVTESAAEPLTKAEAQTKAETEESFSAGADLIPPDAPVTSPGITQPSEREYDEPQINFSDLE